IAAGAGRYIIETIRDMPEIQFAATLCDYKQENVDAVRALADELNVNGAVIARRSDAFNRESLARIQPRATIGIVSGLYELFPSNEPLFILPYLSIDLFFVVAAFLCRTDRELSILAKRIAASIIVAGTCFLLFPLRFAFPRPRADGWPGALFDWFRGMDAPYNLLPSLHAAFTLILLDVYFRHTRGFIRVATMTWFVLIALSPVVTYQHHVIDILGRFVLA